MARFAKAEPVKKPLKASFYGKQGSAKTGTALLVAEGLAARRNGRVAYLDTDPGSGTAPYLVANPARDYHPAPFDIDVLRTRSLVDAHTALDNLAPEHTCIVVDTVTGFHEASREAWEAKNPGKDPSIKDWGPIKKPYKQLIKKLMDSSRDVILIGREKSVFGDDGDGKMTNLGVTMKTDADTAYETDIVLHFFLVGKQGGMTQQEPAFFGEKDRYSIFQGRTFIRPTYATFAPLLPFLGTEAPPSEDDDERAMTDGDLIGDTEKTKTKEAKSAGIMSDLAAKARTATTMEELGAVTAEAKKLKRNMVESHIDALRTVFESKASELSQKIAGSV